MIIDEDELDVEHIYKLLIATIVPRAIGWVSSLSPAGVANLAPFSFFTVVGRKPPVLSLTMRRRHVGWGREHCLSIHNPGRSRIAIVAPQGEVRRVVELLRELQQFHRPKEHKQYLLDFPGFSKVFGMRLTRTPGPTTIELPLHCKHKVQPKSGRVLRRHAAAKSRRSVAYYCSAAYSDHDDDKNGCISQGAKSWPAAASRARCLQGQIDRALAWPGATDTWNFYQAKSIKKSLYAIAAVNPGPEARRLQKTGGAIRQG
jgi:hypothetical protein